MINEHALGGDEKHVVALHLIKQANPFYDTMLTSFPTIVNVPASQPRGYDGSVEIPELKPNTKSVRELERWMRDKHLPFFSEFYNWPLKGRLLCFIDIEVPQKDYSRKDVDNMAKSLLDSMNKIVFEDDRQIDLLIVKKSIALKVKKVPIPLSGFLLAIKKLDNYDGNHFQIPNVFSSGSQIKLTNKHI